MKIDFAKLRKDRLEQINIDMKIAYLTKNWTKYNELKLEKQQIKQVIAENGE